MSASVFHEPVVMSPYSRSLNSSPSSCKTNSKTSANGIFVLCLFAAISVRYRKGLMTNFVSSVSRVFRFQDGVCEKSVKVKG